MPYILDLSDYFIRIVPHLTLFHTSPIGEVTSKRSMAARVAGDVYRER